MAKNYVYFVHGLGKHSKKWIDDEESGNTLRKQIESAWELYPDELEGEFSDAFELVSVHYDDVFTDLYKNWSDQVAKLKTHLSSNPAVGDDLDFLIELAEKPGQGNANNAFFYTHILDLLWYWGNSLVQGKIISHVADQIFSHLKDHYNEDGATFSIVGHSMGTSVVHKVLQSVYTEEKYKDKLSEYLKFQVIMQVSNTSYVLSADRYNHYKTLVRPSLRSDEGVCWSIVNVSHRFDPVSELFPFDPDVEEWLDDDTIHYKDYAYQYIRTNRMTSPDVHSIIHYFENPRVHCAFFETITETEISDINKNKSWDLFVNRTPQGAYKNVKAQYENIIDSKGESFGEFVKSVKQFSELIESFKP